MNNTNATSEVELNLVSDAAKGVGLALMSICILLAVRLMAWVLCHRKSPVVKAMQPIFLVTLCFGIVLSNLTIIPLGVDDSSSIDADRACMVSLWLGNLGDTVTLASLFTKLWRVNQVFHAGSYERKVVTVRRVLWPFAVLLTLNVAFLLTATLVDPVLWVRTPVNDNENNTYGRCDDEGIGTVGGVMTGLMALVQFVALIILCVQAYRARDVRSEYSESRGVALALFSWLQITIISSPMAILVEGSNTIAQYILAVLKTVTITLSLLLFIFLPLISHHRKLQREGGSLNVQRITGFDAASVTPTIGDRDFASARCRISELEVQVKALNNRIAELQDPDYMKAQLTLHDTIESQEEK